MCAPQIDCPCIMLSLLLTFSFCSFFFCSGSKFLFTNISSQLLLVPTTQPVTTGKGKNVIRYCIVTFFGWEQPQEETIMKKTKCQSKSKMMSHEEIFMSGTILDEQTYQPYRKKRSRAINKTPSKIKSLSRKTLPQQ